MAADDPVRFADFFGRLLEPEAVMQDGGCLRIALSGAAIAVLDRNRLHAWCPEAEVRPTPAFAGYAVAVPDLDRVENVLRQAAVRYRRRDDGLQVPPGGAFGAVIEFRAASKHPIARRA
jgi:hypothetical protein